ncbi:MAG: DUF4153 domain-containing protein [Lachnospiraceae bacterium]|nr:DUF4153 domain-containing protein [Lachnospiraceae bacterium]
MEKFKFIIKKAFSYPAMLRSTHPVTAVSIMTATILIAFYSLIESINGFDISDNDMINIILYLGESVAFFSTFALCLESIRPKWSTAVRSAIYALFGILSLIMGFIGKFDRSHTDNPFLVVLRRIEDLLGQYTVTAFTVGLVAVALILALYFSYSHDIDQRFNDHVLNASSSLFFTSIIYGVIQIGVLFLTAIVSALLYDGAFEYLLPIIVLINGLFYVPAAIIAMIRSNERANMFIQVLVRYILLILVSIAYIIIYIYMLKLVFTLSVPSNSVYAILTSLFVISMLVAYMCTSFEQDGFLQKIAYNMPLIFSPFILMQCYTVIVRIGQYGVTPKRYFGIVFIVFEAVYIILYTLSLKKDHEIAGRNLLLVICGFVIFAVFLPGINARALSATLAKHTVSSYIAKTNNGDALSDSEYMRTNAAYDFLNNSYFRNSRTAGYLADMTDDMVSELRNKAGEAAANEREKTKEPTEPSNIWFSCSLEEVMGSGYVDISMYKGMQHVSIGDTSLGDDGHADLTNMMVLDQTVDLSGYCSSMIEPFMQYENDIISWDDYIKAATPLGCIDINENARLYITDADITLENSVPVNASIEGYVFTR